MKVLVYPLDVNPYQELLYREIRNQGVEVKYLILPTGSKTLGLILFYPYLLFLRLSGYKLFHLHWVNFLIPIQGRFFAIISFLNTIFSLIWIRILGFKIIWTVHNFLPHKPETSNDLLVSKLTAYLSNTIIVHSQDTLSKMKLAKARQSSVTIIPIGSYDFYKYQTNQFESRKKLALDQDRFTFFFFGKVRDYKGIDNLLESFDKLAKKHAKISLIIAGVSSEPHLSDLISQFQEKLPNKVFFIDKHIADEEIQYYFKASDVAVFPFKRLTTSSSVSVASYFNTPIIAPSLGNLSDYVIPELLYEQGQDNALYEKMKFALKNLPKIKRDVAELQKEKPQKSWKDVAKMTVEVYKSVDK